MSTHRDNILADLADLTRELVDEVRTNEQYTRDPIGDWQRRTHDQRTTRHFTRQHGLLTQLDAAAVPGGGARDEDSRKTKPTSKAPTTAAFELSCEIITGAAKLRRDLRTAAGRTIGPRQHIADDLREIVALAADVDIELAKEAARQIRSWVHRARVTLHYDSPIVELRDVQCPYCQGPLRVHADASTEVWCATPTCRDDEGRRHTWPRSMWLMLLNTTQQEHTR